jgi:hypothetical protein
MKARNLPLNEEARKEENERSEKQLKEFFDNGGFEQLQRKE